MPVVVQGVIVSTAWFAGAYVGWLRRQTVGREKIFWWLWAAGLCAWGLQWLLVSGSTLLQDVAHQAVALLALALPLASLPLYPEARVDELREPVARLNASLVVLCLLYLFSFMVLPWEFQVDSPEVAHRAFAQLTLGGGLVLAAWTAGRALLRQRQWARIYLALAAVSVVLYVVGPRLLLTGRFVVGMMLCLATLVGWMVANYLAGWSADPSNTDHGAVVRPGWPTALVAIGILLLGGWAGLWGEVPEPVQYFRLFATLEALVVAVVLIFLGHEETDRQGEQLVSRLNAALAELQQWQQRLVQSEKLASLGQLAAGATHEINNPVTAILGYADLMASEPTGTEADRDAAQKVADQARRIRHLVQNMLNLAEVPRAPLETVSVVALLRSAADLRAVAAQLPQGQLQVESAEENLQAAAIAEPLFQVFYRLLSLVGPEPRAATAKVFAEGDSVVVEIRGVLGVGASTPGALLERGAQYSLDQCRQIVGQFGGQLQMESNGNGSVLFRLSLPRATAPSPASPAA